jgi:GH18 family chitinase
MNHVYHGAWYEFTGHDAPLFSNPLDTSYVQQNGLGGVFFWQIMSDIPIDNPNSLINVVGI